MINQLTLVGRLTKDPELRTTSEGIPFTNITLAISRHFKNQQGQIEADFVQCTLWRKVAENTVNYCTKGSVIGITGRIQTRHYDNHEGRRVYVTEVIAETIQFLSKKPTNQHNSTTKQATAHANTQAQYPPPNHAVTEGAMNDAAQGTNSAATQDTDHSIAADTVHDAAQGADYAATQEFDQAAIQGGSYASVQGYDQAAT